VVAVVVVAAAVGRAGAAAAVVAREYHRTFYLFFSCFDARFPLPLAFWRMETLEVIVGVPLSQGKGGGQRWMCPYLRHIEQILPGVQTSRHLPQAVGRSLILLFVCF
jgi:hypothetical protein